ncbi:type II membrane protein [Rhodosporidiobolus nylandii]
MVRSSVPIALWTALVAVSALSAPDCPSLSLGSLSYDLSKLVGVHEWEDQHQTPPTVTKTRYQLSLCGLEDRLLSVVPVAGEIGSGGLDAKAVETEGAKPEEGWTLQLGGGMYNGNKQRAEIVFQCDEKAAETVPSVEEYDPKTGLLRLRWSSSSACPISPSGDDKPAPPSSPDTGDDNPSAPPTDDRGMSFFSWFFTLLFFGIIAYFAFGIWSNYNQYGSTGWDAVPHRDVLRDLPYVVADLFKGRGGSRSGYSSLG